MAGRYAKNDATKKRSKVTGKKFARQDPTVRKHGPNNRRQVYAAAIQQALEFTQDEGWVPSSYIAEMANKHVSNFWTKLNGHSVGAIMREYEKKGHVISRKSGVKEWKLIKQFSKNL